MTLEELKPGDVFYNVNERSIIKYEYLMTYPFHNPKNRVLHSYHIIINKCTDEPKRMYYTAIQDILKLNCNIYEEAKLYQIKLLEKHIEFLKSKLLIIE